MIINHTDGKKTYLKEVGQSGNPAILFLHGIGADHQMWGPQYDWFASQDYYILIPDLLGHGQSSKVASLELGDWDNQILTILKEKSITSCILIGASMGGVIAQSFSAKHPEMVQKLILVDTFGELKSIQEKFLGASQVLGFKIYSILGAKILAKGMASAYKAPHASLAREYFSQASLNADFQQLILARKAINQADLIGKVDGRKAPTLILVGADFGKTFVEINRKIRDGIEGSKFIILENAMDPSNLVNPESFNNEVLSFLST